MKLKYFVAAMMVLVVAAAGWKLWSARHRMVAPVVQKAPPMPKPPFQVRPATKEEKAQPKPPEPEKPKPPIRVNFKAPAPGKQGAPIPVAIAVEADLPEEPGAPELELLLRLPAAGIELKSEGWTPAELPADEKNDPSGPWALFQKKGIIPTQASTGRWEAQETVNLTVKEPGTNWIVTTRARLTRAGQSWQTFGAIFASVEGDQAEFHTVPRAPKTEQRAQTN